MTVVIESTNASITVDDHSGERQVVVEGRGEVVVEAVGAQGAPGLGSRDVGWVSYRESDEVSVSSGVRTKLECDGLASTIGTYLDPSRIRWDTATHKLLASDNSRDWVIVRVSMTITALLAEREVTLEIDIGGAQGVISTISQRLGRSAGVAEKRTFVFPVFSLATFAANGGEIFITIDGAATVADTEVAAFQ